MIVHDTFTLDRTYDAPLAEVWRCWTDPELRPRWFHGPEGWDTLERSHDFRVGGRELLRGRMPSGTETKFLSTFHVIVPERYIITTYDMYVGDPMMSVTLATMEIEPAGKGTRLRYTEQGTFFDGNPKSAESRKKGTSWHLDNLAEVLRR
jgi:uncharacterized protein YndB with AHSA1/START domain